MIGQNEYGRIIAVQLPAKDKMAANYKEKLPQATIDSIIGEVKTVPEEAPLNTPDVAGGSVIAPGIVETPVVDTMDMPTNMNEASAVPISPILEPPVVNPEVAVPNVSPLDSGSSVSPIENEQSVQNIASSENVNNVPDSINVEDLEKEMESVILEAQNIFLESAKNLANKIIAEAIQKVKDKTN